MTEQGMRERLRAWLGARAGGPVAVDELVAPASGMSNDTWLTTVDLGDGALDVVLRLAPAGRGLFPRYDLGQQVTVLRGLRAHSDVPVPDVLWHEPDPEPLGRPFYVMTRVRGRIPPDGHHFDGWVRDLPPADRTRLVGGALDVLARIHAVDVDAAGLGVLDRSEHGADPIDQELGAWRAYLDWAADGAVLMRLEAAYEWCAEHRPPPPTARGLVWGDARLGNLVVDDALSPVAVLDWEMAVLGPPELDVGWFLFLERTALQYAEPLPGFPDRAGIVAAVEHRLGRPLADVDWYEAWGGLRAACIQVRLAESPEARERNPVTKALRGLLASLTPR